MGSLGPEVISPKDKNRILFECLPANLPVANITQDIDLNSIAWIGIQQLKHLQKCHLSENAVWRDLCALSGSFRTFYGAQRIWSAWSQLRQVHHPSAFNPIPGTFEIIRSVSKHSWVQIGYNFETKGHPEMKCSGFIGLVPDSKDPTQWRIWMLTTLLEEIKGLGSPDNMPIQPLKSEAPQATSPRNGTYDKELVHCVVVGAGFSGLCTAGRLKALGVRTIVLEKNPHVGDNWKNRYDSARFHTTKQYCDFPFGRTFTDADPTFPGRLDLVRSYDEFVKRHRLDIRCSSWLKSALYDEERCLWTLSVAQGTKITIMHARHIVMAIGGLGAVPNMPKLAGRELFQGEVMHSFDYKSAHQWTGKAGVVIGSANTAHDVAEDMVDAAMSSVTLVQRTATPVFPIEWYKDWMDSYYHDQYPLEYADRRTSSLPIAIGRHISMNYYQNRMKQDPEKLNALERAGFDVERSGDMVKCAFGDGAGGHHTDVGGGEKIIAGQIKVKSNTSLVRFTSTGVVFADGSTLDADVVVFCTGFHTNMRLEVAKIVGPEIARRLDNFWGIDEEGELNGAFKRMKQPGIWFIGGGAPWARFGSRFLALQVKSDIAGCPLPVYNS